MQPLIGLCCDLCLLPENTSGLLFRILSETFNTMHETWGTSMSVLGDGQTGRTSIRLQSISETFLSRAPLRGVCVCLPHHL